MQYAAGASVCPFYTHVTGQFSAESQYSGMTDIGEQHPVDSLDVIATLGDHTTFHAGEIKVVTDFDPEALALVGLNVINRLDEQE